MYAKINTQESTQTPNDPLRCYSHLGCLWELQVKAHEAVES